MSFVTEVQIRSHFEEKSIMTDKFNVDVTCFCIKIMLILSDNNFFQKSI